MYLIKSFLAGLVAVSLCNAQSVNISGMVKDTGGTAISGASVKLELGGQTATTGSDGRFNLSGPSEIKLQMNKTLPQSFTAVIKDNFLVVNLGSRSIVEISSYTILGKTISVVRRTMHAGVNSVALSPKGTGCFFYCVKTGNNKVMIKNISIRETSGQSIASMHGSSCTLAKRAKVAVAINDVIAVTKTGYLNYRTAIYNSDTSGIDITMIVTTDTVKDADGNTYHALRIGNQVWTVENLRVTKYNDGAAIPNITKNATWDSCLYTKVDAYCYYNNTTNGDSIEKYGALYNWHAVATNKLAPMGWHVPSDAEWNTLQTYLITNGANWDGTTTGNKIAKSMATKTDWNTYTGTGSIGKDLTINNRSGFSALPAGNRFSGTFFDQGNFGGWWGATETDASTAWDRSLYYGYDYLRKTNDVKRYGLSVRLVKDN